MKLRVIDVSEFQGKIDWKKVKPQIDGAILRCGYGMDLAKQDDGMFKSNADECTRLGIPFGVYLYSYADTEEKIRSEAAHVLRLVKGYKLAFPIYLDLEEAKVRPTARKHAEIFGDIIEAAGYWCGIYAGIYWWWNELNGLERFTKWVPQYNTVLDYTAANTDMWQYTGKGKVDGISGDVDLNECYRDFPAEILGNAAADSEPTPEPAPAPEPTPAPEPKSLYRIHVGEFEDKRTAENMVDYLDKLGVAGHIVEVS